MIQDQKVGVQDKVTITSVKPTREGYVFKGWSQTKQNDCDLTTVCSADYQANQELLNGIPNASKDQTYNLYAVWEPIQYHISFEGNNESSGTMGGMLVTYGKEEKLDVNTYQKTGYHFTGWNTQANGSGISYIDEAIVKNLTSLQGDTVSLFAQWSPNQYKIEFDPNGGIGSMTNLDMIYDKEQILPANTLYKDGYVFKGWSTSANGNVIYQDKDPIKNLTTKQNDVVKLYAVWQAIPANTYIIHYDANGGDGDSYEQVVEVGKEVIIDDGKKFSKKGYTFTGWSTVAKASDFYQPGEIHKDLAPVGHTFILYAQWTKNTVNDNPSTDGNGTTQQPNHPSTDGNGTTQQPNQPSTDGNGTTQQPNHPSTDGNGTTQQPNHPSTDGNVGGNKEFTITFIKQDGSKNTIKVSEGEYVTLPNINSLEEGYTFIGWSLLENGDVMYEANQRVLFSGNNDVVLYAQYIKDTSNQENSVNTGDKTSYHMYICTAILSFIIICLMLYRKRYKI